MGLNIIVISNQLLAEQDNIESALEFLVLGMIGTYLGVFTFLYLIFKISKKTISIGTLIRYLLATSILFSPIFIMDIPIRLLGYNVDHILEIFYLIISILISIDLVRFVNNGKIILCLLFTVICTFYWPTAFIAFVKVVS